MRTDADTRDILFEIRPSFEPWLALRLRSVAAEGGRVWRLDCELMGFALEAGSWEVAVDTETAEALLADFTNLDLDRTAAKSIGVDGTAFRLVVGSGSTRQTLSWWSVLPRQWKGLAPLLERLLRLGGARAKEFAPIE